MQKMLPKVLLSIFLYLLLGILCPQYSTGKTPKKRHTTTAQAIKRSKPIAIKKEIIELAIDQNFIWLAAVLRKLEIGKQFNINQANPDDTLDNTALHEAARLGEFTIFKVLLQQKATINSRNKEGYTPLHLAAVEGHQEIVKLLLAQGIDINLATKDKSTALHLAVAQGKQAIVKLLLDQGADIEAKNEQQNSPLYIAASKGHKEVVKLLIGRKANIETKGGLFKDTPLYEAAYEGYKDIVKLLLDKKANMQAQSKIGYLPLHAAILGGHTDIVELLIQHKANIEVKNVTTIEVKSKYIYLETPLHLAIYKGYSGIVALLLRHGANINATNQQGHTPLMVAQEALNSNLNTPYKDIYEIIVNLLEQAKDNK